MMCGNFCTVKEKSVSVNCFGMTMNEHRLLSHFGSRRFRIDFQRKGVRERALNLEMMQIARGRGLGIRTVVD